VSASLLQLLEELHGGALTLTFPAGGGTSVTIAAATSPPQQVL